MSKEVLQIIIYLAGIPITYLFCKRWMIRTNIRTWKNILPDKKPWTVKDRRFIIFIALTSWLGFVYTLIFSFTDFVMWWSEQGKDKIAKW